MTVWLRQADRLIHNRRAIIRGRVFISSGQSPEDHISRDLIQRAGVALAAKGLNSMLHYSCDLCGQKIEEQRFVVKLEVFPTFDPDAITEDDLDRDNLSEISELLAEMELTGELELDDAEPKSFRYDLCPECHRQYSKDPLARHRIGRMRFSEN